MFLGWASALVPFGAHRVGGVRIRRRSIAWAVTALVAWLALGPATVHGARFRDLPPGHWAHGYAAELGRRGVLRGYPDGTFRGDRPVDRYTLARALGRTIEVLEGPQTTRPSAADQARLAALAREVGPELRTLGLRVGAIEERLAGTRSDARRLEGRVERLEHRLRHDETIWFDGGELRVVGFNNEEIKSFTNLILTLRYRLSEQVRGVLAPQLTNRFDRIITDPLDIWEAYADFDGLGPITRVRAGRFLYGLGAGLTLLNRVEGFQITGEYGDLTLEVVFLGDLLLLAETEAFTGQSLGFYYIEQGRNVLGDRPLHVGLYLKGPINDRLSYGLEYANFSNRRATLANHNLFTEAFLGDLRWRMSPRLSLRLAAISQAEDFRALSIDRDLSFHSPLSSPLEDVLQALSIATRMNPFPTDRNEINGFTDLKVALDITLGKTKTVLGLDLDHLTDHSRFFDNTASAFDVVGGRLRRQVSSRSWVELRARRVDFSHPDPLGRRGTLTIPRTDRSEIRLQFFGTF